MLEKVGTETQICGAKLRDGTLCSMPPTNERGRCVKHGGAPRSGAPKGNSNALKRGVYADGRVGLKLDVLERAVEEVMTLAARYPFATVPTTAAEKAIGQGVFNDTTQMLSKVTSMLARRGRLDVATRTALFARRDALSFLLKDPTWFESAAAFRWGVSLTFERRLTARTKLRDDSQMDRFDYSRAWGKFCRELYLRAWPEADPQPKPD